MKCQIPQISWHSRDPVLSIDFQPCDKNKFRLASGGTDSHVLIWYVTYQENKSISIECASDLYRHNKSVNVVRFSPNGDLLASGDDEGALIVWQLKERNSSETPKDEENLNQEEWYPFKVLRGHLEDIYDISWSADGNFMVSGSLDNTAIMWDMQKFQKVHIFADSKGYVQGVTWDPLNLYIGTLGTDRALRIININFKKTAFKVLRAPWSVTNDKGTFRARLFHDDTLKSYFRRLCFTPDGQLLIVPSGILEKDEKSINTTYIFSRHSPNKPVACLPTGDKYTVAVKCNPLLYKLRKSEDKENQGTKCILNLPYRMVFAVAASDSVIIYDTEQLVPIAYVSNIHYTHLTDLTWSADGRILVASSTDGYCSFVIFDEGELGEVYVPPPPIISPKKEENVKEAVVDLNKTPICKSEELPEKIAKKASNKTDKETEKTSQCKKTEFDKTKSILLEKKPIAISPNEKSPCVVKPKKPKLTIESFFVSPKTKPVSGDKHLSSTTEVKESANSKTSSNVTVKVEVNFDSVKSSTSFTDAIKETVRNQDKMGVITPMDVEENIDNDSVQYIGEIENSEILKPKCRIQLDFADKIESADNKSSSVELLDDSAVLSFPTTDEKTAVDISKQEDWKLELSQDEEFAPMDIVESSSKDKVKSSTSPMDNEPSTSKEVKQSPVQTTPKPKRRVNLITLSKSISKTPPKQ